MLIPVAVVLTGAVPINAPGIIFAPFFVATLGLQFVALRLLARGHYPPILSLLFEVLRMPAVCRRPCRSCRPAATATSGSRPRAAARAALPVAGRGRWFPTC